MHLGAIAWLADMESRLAATIPGSKPKRFVQITNDMQLQSMILKALDMEVRLELFVSTHERAIEESMDNIGMGISQKYIQPDQTRVREVISLGGTMTTSFDDTHLFEDSDIIFIDNEEDVEDDADDCYSIDKFHDLMSFDDDVSYDKEDMETANYQLEVGEDRAVFDANEVDPVIVVGAKFRDVEYLRVCLRQHSIKTNFTIKLEKSDKERIVSICVAKRCPWRLRACRLADKRTFEIRKMESKHSCSGVNKAGNNAANANWVSRKILQDVRKNPNITPKEIMKMIDIKYSLQIPYGRAWRGREEAREVVFGNVEDSYDYIPSLVGELVSRNPGSHIVYELEGDKSFQRVFVSFKSCTHGFKSRCRPFFGVDGCHLRTKYLGKLLSATALDGNNGLYPIGFAIVDGEKEMTRLWFFNQLKQALETDMDRLTIISDPEKGLQEAIA